MEKGIVSTYLGRQAAVLWPGTWGQAKARVDSFERHLT